MNTRNESGSVHHRWTNRVWRNTAIGILTIAVLGLATALEAKKPVPPPEPEPVEMDDGLLYYTAYNFGDPSVPLYEQDTLTGIEYVASYIPYGSQGANSEPSKLDHNGRWCLLAEYSGEYPPNDDTNLPENRYSVYVQGLQTDYGYFFYDDPRFEISLNGGQNWRWLDNDNRIWVLARYRTEDFMDIVEGSVGIYELQVDWSTGEPLMTGIPAYVAGGEFIPVIYSGDGVSLGLDINSFDVSPDMTTLYYSTPSGVLTKLDLSSGQSTPLAVNFISPRYHEGLDALVGSGLYGDGIFRINADGTGLTTVLAKEFTMCYNPVWSPAGNQVAYEHHALKRNFRSLFRQIRIVNAVDGSGTVEVSPEQSGDVTTMGWVMKP